MVLLILHEWNNNKNMLEQILRTNPVNCQISINIHCRSIMYNMYNINTHNNCIYNIGFQLSCLCFPTFSIYVHCYMFIHILVYILYSYLLIALYKAFFWFYMWTNSVYAFRLFLYTDCSYFLVCTLRYTLLSPLLVGLYSRIYITNLATTRAVQ